MKGEGQLSSPGVRLPGVLALSLPLDQVNVHFVHVPSLQGGTGTTTHPVMLPWG